MEGSFSCAIFIFFKLCVPFVHYWIIYLNLFCSFPLCNEVLTLQGQCHKIFDPRFFTILTHLDPWFICMYVFSHIVPIWWRYFHMQIKTSRCQWYCGVKMIIVIFQKIFSALKIKFQKISLDPFIHSLNYFHEEAKGFEDISLLFLNTKSCRCQCHRGVFFMTSRSHSCFFDQLAVKGISCWKSKLVKISIMELLSWLSTVQQG